jgi:hypothetical protein
MAVETEATREKNITVERAIEFFYVALFVVVQGVWVSLIVWLLLLLLL